jgi:SAM-dependent methyltransferase
LSAENPFELHLQRRGLFSSDVAAYDTGRPGYPARVYELLQRVCGLGSGSRVLEIGPGTGQATVDLLRSGATVTAVELGAEMAAALEAKYGGQSLTVQVGAFEDVDLDPGSFDLIVAATSFHWIPPETGIRRCADLLHRGGWLALWWNYFGDPARPDPFRDAVIPVFEELAPSLIDTFPGIAFLAGAHPHATDAQTRTSEIDATGRFGPVHYEAIPWTGRHTPAQLRALFASYSPCLALPPAQRALVLDAIEHLAHDKFACAVERPYLTLIYLAQRRS